MAVYAYLRVSTDAQVDSGAGLASQRDLCNDWACRNNTVVSEYYTEYAVSGAVSLDDRPMLLQAIDALRAHDVLLVARRDRLGRDVYVTAMIEAAIKRKKSTLISVTEESTNGDEPEAIVLKHIINAFSEYERVIIKKRIRKAMAAKKARNERVGRIPFGKEIADDGVHLIENINEQYIINKILELSERKTPSFKISDQLNIEGYTNRGGLLWNPLSIRRLLKRFADKATV
jgi:site-specific DNA recombinase